MFREEGMLTASSTDLTPHILIGGIQMGYTCKHNLKEKYVITVSDMTFMVKRRTRVGEV